MAAKWSIDTDDRALIKACLRHDRVAQGCFYQKYFADAYRTCNRYLPRYADVMAVVNAGFLNVFRHLDRYDPLLGTPGAWIHRIMVHSAIDHIRSEHRRVDADPLPEQPGAEGSVENEGPSSLEAEALLLLVKQLPPVTRAVFNMSVMEGYSHKEVAEELGISESTSRWHLSEARKQLQRLVGKKPKMISA